MITDHHWQTQHKTAARAFVRLACLHTALGAAERESSDCQRKEGSEADLLPLLSKAVWTHDKVHYVLIAW